MSARTVWLLVALNGLAAHVASTAHLDFSPAPLVSPSLVDAPDTLPISTITLYRSGVGYFQRQGLIDGNTRVQLRFKTDQINDILKSMVLLDLGGGHIDAVSYSSKEPLQKRLSSFAVDISDSPDLPKLLSRLRGAPIAVQTTDGVISGTVLGIEQQTVSTGDTTYSTPFVNLVTRSGIRSIRIQSIASFDILDPQLADELNKALLALAEHRTDLTKSVDLSFRGSGAREVVVAYIHEMPVWKTSYRLILPEDDVRGRPTIQGWAIVENTTDEDWKNVRLSLVSGQPIGFVMDLYEPLFLTRPQVPVPVMRGIGPVVFEAGRDVKDFARLEIVPSSRPAPAPSSRLRERASPGAVSDSAAGLEFALTADDLTGFAAGAQAGAAEVGEVFQYVLKNPVSIDRQQSAMIPLLSSPLEGRRVSIVNTSNLARHPMRGVEVTNTSDLQLLPGPITVFDGAAFAGDAQIGHVSVGDKRLLAYAVDLDVSVSVEETWTNDVTRIRIVRGSLERTIKNISTATYSLDSKDRNRPRTIIVEHPRLPGWQLLAPAEPTERTDALYRFEVALAPGKAGTLKVQQEQVQSQTFAVVGANLTELLAFQSQGKVSPRVIEAVRQAAALQAEVVAAEQRVAALENETREISTDQNRIRSNLASIDRNSDLYRRYVTTLNEQENRIEQIRTELAKARADVIARRTALQDYVSSLNID
ncbi:MAG: hypothetical protein KF866_02980 [Phycisphaeraceae bacterium]|nr:hypothetical protein [Phycisphaeraceae bacterium]MCW5753340.1 hypothetical protein [Phycisphaeraceae bacterium]